MIVLGVGQRIFVRAGVGLMRGWDPCGRPRGAVWRSPCLSGSMRSPSGWGVAVFEHIKEASMSFAVGSLVRARGREWVVLPESDEQMLILRPLGGSEDEVTGIYVPLEQVDPATFDLPDPRQLGDERSCRLLRDAVRLGFRSSAGPFRSFARIAVEPRPYKLVPLLMALKLDPVRLLIADDVGIGKTIEAALIARELTDRGEIERFAVLCPPHLVDQWIGELEARFHFRPVAVTAASAGRLERDL